MLGRHRGPITRPLTSQQTAYAVDLNLIKYFSDVGKVTSANDSPAHTYLVARAIQAFSYRRSAVNGRRFGGGSTFAGAEIELDNTDGALNSLVNDYAIDGRELTVKVGHIDWRYTDMFPLFDGTAFSWRFGGDEKVFINPASNAASLTRKQYQTTKYAGTGGAEGGDDLKGKPKPKGWGGPHYNVPPPLLNSDNVYQLRDGAIVSVSNVYDRGVALPLDTAIGTNGDFATYAALVAATIAAGKYATCIALGYIRTASQAVGQLTCTFTSTSANKIGEIVKQIVLNHGGYVAADLDSNAFTALDTSHSDGVELWIGTEERTVADVLDEILSWIEGYWGDNRLGGFTVGAVTIPSGGYVDRWTDGELVSLEKIEMPIDVRPAVKRVTVNYQKNYFLQTTDLDAAITAANKQFIQQNFRSVTSLNSLVADVYLLATEIEVDTGFVTSTGATEQRTRLKTLYEGDYGLWRAKTGHRGFQRDIGDVVQINSTRRSIVDRSFRIVEVGIDAAAYEAEFVLIG